VAECIPFAKTGGLADVAGSLPRALTTLGHDVHIVMPLYQQVWESTIKPQPTKRQLLISIGPEYINTMVWQARLTEAGPTVYFLQYDPFFDRADLYRSALGSYSDNDRRFLFLCRGALELGKSLGIYWDVIHCHDWHTGLIPVFLKTLYQDTSTFANVRSLITIHNLAYQGYFPKETFALTGLPEKVFVPEGVEFWGGFNFLKAGLVYADWINTVSYTYAQEIQSQEYGYGLEGVLRVRHSHLSGILNGVDYTIWNPSQDEYIPFQYDAQRITLKQKVKAALITATHLQTLDHAPVIGVISRLDDQKGFDLLAVIVEKLMQQNLQLVVLGTGEKKYHDLFLRIKAKYPRKFSLHLEFNEALAHLIYGGADMFLMPSKYEPCGLGQLISMRYGTIPIVRRTGGLADTVLDFQNGKGNGFSFEDYTGEALLETIQHACQVFNDKKNWKKLMYNAMSEDFSWDRSAREYEQLYRKILRE